MMKMKIMLAASILCAMTTTCAGAADMTDNMGNMAGRLSADFKHKYS